MKRDRFMWVCMENEAGRDTFVKNPTTHEEGLVMDFGTNDLKVRTNRGNSRNWGFAECEELPIIHDQRRWC